MMRNLYWVIEIGVLAISGLYYEGNSYCMLLLHMPYYNPSHV
jgi:hypothetical protein